MSGSPSPSVALATKLIDAPTEKLEPLPGDVIVTLGELLVIVTLIESDPGLPLLSVTDAVIVCGPAERLPTLIDPPVPIGPSTLDTHAIDAVRATGSSRSSVALATKLIDVPRPKLEPLDGEVIVTLGSCANAVDATNKVAISSRKERHLRHREIDVEGLCSILPRPFFIMRRDADSSSRLCHRGSGQ